MFSGKYFSTELCTELQSAENKHDVCKLQQSLTCLLTFYYICHILYVLSHHISQFAANVLNADIENEFEGVDFSARESRYNFASYLSGRRRRERGELWEP